MTDDDRDVYDPDDSELEELADGLEELHKLLDLPDLSISDDGTVSVQFFCGALKRHANLLKWAIPELRYRGKKEREERQETRESVA